MKQMTSLFFIMFSWVFNRKGSWGRRCIETETSVPWVRQRGGGCCLLGNINTSIYCHFLLPSLCRTDERIRLRLFKVPGSLFRFIQTFRYNVLSYQMRRAPMPKCINWITSFHEAISVNKLFAKMTFSFRYSAVKCESSPFLSLRELLPSWVFWHQGWN